VFSQECNEAISICLIVTRLTTKLLRSIKSRSAKQSYDDDNDILACRWSFFTVLSQIANTNALTPDIPVECIPLVFDLAGVARSAWIFLVQNFFSDPAEICAIVCQRLNSMLSGARFINADTLDVSTLEWLLTMLQNAEVDCRHVFPATVSSWQAAKSLSSGILQIDDTDEHHFRYCVESDVTGTIEEVLSDERGNGDSCVLAYVQVGEYTLHKSGGKGKDKGSGGVTGEPWHVRQKKLLTQNRLAREERLADFGRR
jgi:hypothetical protein